MADAWQERRYAGPWLEDCCGRRLRVVFPGRRWGRPGPDFMGAVLAGEGGQLVHGDVEVHVRSSNWVGHRHGPDPAYRRVVLHVVRRVDLLLLDTSGWHVPTVAIEPDPPADWSSRPPPEAVPCLRPGPAVLAVVAAAGQARFRGRVARFEGDLAAAEPNQVVWRGVAEAVGWSANAKPFGTLADAVPWSEAAPVVTARGPVGLAGLLLGTAGLLGAASLPEAHHWRALQRERNLRPVLTRAAWDRRQVRAANTPPARCRGLAELAARWADGGAAGPHAGLAEQVLAAVQRAVRAQRPVLWPFGCAPPYVGRGRAQVIAINVLLPFAAAAGLEAEAQQLFASLPGEPPNRVLRYMAAQLGEPVVRFRGACAQQGLLHLFTQSCASRVCGGCPAQATHGPRPPG